MEKYSKLLLLVCGVCIEVSSINIVRLPVDWPGFNSSNIDSKPTVNGDLIIPSLEHDSKETLSQILDSSPECPNCTEGILKIAYPIKNFYLFTPEHYNGHKYEYLYLNNDTNIMKSHFKKRKTFVLLHGFLGTGLSEWVINLKNSILRRFDANVIAVDWDAGSSYINYMSAVKNVKLAGYYTTYLLSKLQQYIGLDFTYVHLIGHSLGAHAAGFAGKMTLINKFGRITGLEPAGLEFTEVNVTERLDKSDATYVDVIHTNSCPSDFIFKCYGIDENIGHSDFWVNGGMHQPHCVHKKKKRRSLNEHPSEDLPSGVNIFGDIGCSHMISHTYYTESLNYTINDTYFLARTCDDYDTFQKGNCSCGKFPQYMGINVNVMMEGVFYLDTNAHPLYARRDKECPAGSSADGSKTIHNIAIRIVMGSAVILSIGLIVFVISGIRARCLRTNEPGFIIDDDDVLINYDTLSEDRSNDCVSADDEDDNDNNDDDECLLRSTNITNGTTTSSSENVKNSKNIGVSADDNDNNDDDDDECLLSSTTITNSTTSSSSANVKDSSSSSKTSVQINV